MNSIKDGNASWMTTTFSILQSWRQRGHVDAESIDKITNIQEKSQVSTGDTRFTGVVVVTAHHSRNMFARSETSSQTPSSMFAFKYYSDYGAAAPTRTGRGNQVTASSDANNCAHYCA